MPDSTDHSLFADGVRYAQEAERALEAGDARLATGKTAFAIISLSLALRGMSDDPAVERLRRRDQRKAPGRQKGPPMTRRGHITRSDRSRETTVEAVCHDLCERFENHGLRVAAPVHYGPGKHTGTVRIYFEDRHGRQTRLSVSLDWRKRTCQVRTWLPVLRTHGHRRPLTLPLDGTTYAALFETSRRAFKGACGPIRW